MHRSISSPLVTYTLTTILLIAGCRGPELPTASREPDKSQHSANAWFADVALEWGINYSWMSGQQAGRFFLPEITGGGVGLFDMDNDGDLDLYFPQGDAVVMDERRGVGNSLYENLGDGAFRDVSDTAGDAADRGYGMGVAAGDFNNDGFTDLYVTNLGPNALLRNNGDGTFSNIADSAGVDHDGWGTSAAFLDYDADGDLDLFCVNYLFWTAAEEIECFSDSGSRDYCSPASYRAPAPDLLYRNEGNGKFTDVSSSSGITSAFGNGLGVTLGDFNSDGLIDVFVANDTTRNQLWMNNGDGTFADAASITGCALDRDGMAKAGMGTDAFDVDNDGDEDLLVVNLRTQSDSFYRNEGAFFSDDTSLVGLGMTTRPFTRFGVSFTDFNNDGCPEIYYANGAVALPKKPTGLADPYAEPDVLVVGRPAVRFGPPNKMNGAAGERIHTGRGAAFGDLDNDGRMDIVVVNKDAPAYVLHNVIADAGNFVMLRLVNEHGRDDIGAVVTMSVAGEEIQRRVRTAYSYLAANDPRIHVGLGDHDVVMNLQVRWSDRQQEEFGDVAAGTFHTLVKGTGMSL